MGPSRPKPPDASPTTTSTRTNYSVPQHPLNRGGDRQANYALYILAVTRVAWDPTTKAYVARRTTEGKTKKEIIRCLKRHIAREDIQAPHRTPATTASRRLTPIGASARSNVSTG